MERMNNYTDKNSLELLFDEIEKNIKSKAFLSALIMSLTIPDMLGKLAYPELDKVRDRYIKWFDENVRNLFGLLYSDDFYKKMDSPRMCGEVCYQLRCKLFHEGVNDLEDKTGINEFVLSVNDEDFVRGNCAGGDYLFDQWNPGTNEIPHVSYLYISCKELCSNITNAAKAFIENNPNLNYPKLRINYGGGRISDIWLIK